MEKCSLCGKPINPIKETSITISSSKKNESFTCHSKCFDKLPGLMAKRKARKAK